MSEERVVICAPFNGGDEDYTLQECRGALRATLQRGSIEQLKAFAIDFYGDGDWEESRDIADILIYRRKLNV